MTYAIPLGSTSRSLKVLRKSLLAEGEVEIEAVAEDTSIPVTSGKQCAESSVTYLHTDKAKSGHSVAIRLLTQFDMTAAVGRISAETVSDEYVVDALHCTAQCCPYRHARLHVIG